MWRSEAGAGAELPGVQRRGRNYLTISLRRLLANKVGVVCLTVIVLMYGAGLFAPLVTPYAYNDQNLDNVKQSPSLGHPFGTDRLGRDILTRVIYGLRTTVILTIVTLTTGTLALGITLGLVAGYFGRLTDTIIMRIGEITTSFPDIFLVLIIVLTVRPPMVEWMRGVEDTLGVEFIHLGIADYFALSLGLALFSWFGMARLVRGQVLQAREEQYVDAARAVGCRDAAAAVPPHSPQRGRAGYRAGIGEPRRGRGGGGVSQLLGHRNTAAGAEPRPDDIRERQPDGAEDNAAPADVPHRHAGDTAVHFQPAGRRGERRLQSAGALASQRTFLD